MADQNEQLPEVRFGASLRLENGSVAMVRTIGRSVHASFSDADGHPTGGEMTADEARLWIDMLDTARRVAMLDER